MSALTPDMPVCSQEAARAAGLDVAPSPTELLAVAESIVSSWGDRAADPDDVVASTADAGAQLARAVPLVLAEVDRLRARVAELETSIAPRLCFCGHSRHAHTVPAPHSCFAYGQTCPCPTYQQLPPGEAWEQQRKNIAAREALAADEAATQ
ncbi:hypothetical protein [Streptomyces atratus]|uniref:hypothetical protein n=1 Tax=Streptomyces atratus TaxID=1893 RepID=UPI002F91BC89